MKTIETEIHVDASPEEVWQVLVDFSRFEWNPFFSSIEGELEKGARLAVTFKKPKLTMRPTVTEVEPARVLEWLGHLGFRGIFDGRHRFEIRADGAGARFRQSEQFSGLLVPLLGGMLADTRKGFEALNQALKTEVERRRAA